MRTTDDPKIGEPETYEPKPDRREPDDVWLDQRLLEFAGVVAMVVLIAAGVHYINHVPRTDTASFIVPSQTVRW